MIRAESRTEVDDRLGFARLCFRRISRQLRHEGKGLPEAQYSKVIQKCGAQDTPGMVFGCDAHGVRNPLVASLRLLAGRRSAPIGSAVASRPALVVLLLQVGVSEVAIPLEESLFSQTVNTGPNVEVSFWAVHDPKLTPTASSSSPQNVRSE
jgi:hypothetical protein